MKHLLKLMAPPPSITVSEWSEQYRYLSSEYSAEPGRYSADRTPYAIEMMNCINDDSIEEIILMTGTQLGKSTVIENVIAYLVCNNPAPMLMVQPNHKIVESVSKDRIAPLIRDTPELKKRFADDKQHKSESTIKIKKFDGGQLTLVGSNSPGDLASRSIKYLFCDEIDRNERGAGREGDAISLAYKRTTNFPNRKIILTSTPTIKNESRIEAAYEESDKRKYFVPCPHCGVKQFLVFGRLKWQKTETNEHLPETTVYECEFCKKDIHERHKQQMLLDGEWIAEAKGKSKAGFWISALYSPWRSWQSIVAEWVDVNASKDKERLKTFINTTLAETFEDKGEQVEENKLMERLEDYSPNEKLPEGVLFLTASVDVQEGFLSAEICGWGMGRERWGIERRIIIGNTKLQSTFNDLGAFLFDGYPKNIPPEDRLKPQCVCVDSGYNTVNVKAFVAKNGYRRVYAIKGMAGSRPLISKPKRGSGAGVVLVGVDEAKDRILLNSLRLTEPGPEFYHFPKCNGYDFDYFKELTAEQRKTKYSNGFSTKYWAKISKSQPNEALDNAVYNLAALHLLNPNWESLKRTAEAEMKLKAETPEKPKEDSEDEKQIAAKKEAEAELRRVQRMFKKKGTSSWVRGSRDY